MTEGIIAMIILLMWISGFLVGIGFGIHISKLRKIAKSSCTSPADPAIDEYVPCEPGLPPARNAMLKNRGITTNQ